MEDNQRKHSYEYLWFVASIFITVIITMIFTYSYIFTQKNKRIKEERSKHTWSTDFVFPSSMNLKCNYNTDQKGYQYSIEWSIKNQSGYDATIHHIYVKFFDENDYLITIYDIYNVGYIRNEEIKKISTVSSKYYKKVPTNTMTIINIEYDLDIK